jgi:hypothetical protein
MGEKGAKMAQDKTSERAARAKAETVEPVDNTRKQLARVANLTADAIDLLSLIDSYTGRGSDTTELRASLHAKLEAVELMANGSGMGL